MVRKIVHYKMASRFSDIPMAQFQARDMIKNGKPEGFWTSYYVTGVKKSEGRRTKFHARQHLDISMIRQVIQLKK